MDKTWTFQYNSDHLTHGLVWYHSEDTKIGSLEADRSGLSEQVRSVSLAKVHQLRGLILLQIQSDNTSILHSFRNRQSLSLPHSHPRPSDHFGGHEAHE